MRTTGRVRVSLVLACLAVVLGILGMHALNHEASMVAQPGTASAGMTHGPAGAQAALETGAVLDTGAALVSASGSEQSMGDMVMLCVAMLIGAAAGLLLALGLRRLATARSVDVLWGRVAARVRPQRVATGPPYVWEFSVIRC